jgi:hypothetical protein
MLALRQPCKPPSRPQAGLRSHPSYLACLSLPTQATYYRDFNTWCASVQLLSVPPAGSHGWARRFEIHEQKAKTHGFGAPVGGSGTSTAASVDPIVASGPTCPATIASCARQNPWTRRNEQRCHGRQAGPVAARDLSRQGCMLLSASDNPSPIAQVPSELLQPVRVAVHRAFLSGGATAGLTNTTSNGLAFCVAP